MRGGRSYFPLDDILPPPAEDMIDDIGQESDDDGEMRRPNPRSFLTTKSGFQSLNGSFKRGLSDSSDTLKLSETVLLVSLPITSKALMLMRMWLGYASTITLWILPLQALWPIGCVQEAAQLQISRCEDGMHWLDGCLRISVVGGYFSGTLEGGRMGDNLEFFGEVLCLFLVFRLFYYYIIHIHAWRAVLRVHDDGINRWDVYFWEWHSGSDRNPCMAIM